MLGGFRYSSYWTTVVTIQYIARHHIACHIRGMSLSTSPHFRLFSSPRLGFYLTFLPPLGGGYVQRTTWATEPRSEPYIPGAFNLLSSRANLHLSYNTAGPSHCRLQNHHGYIKHHHRGMGGQQVTQVKCLRHSSFFNPSAASPTSQVILQPFRYFTYVTGTSRTSPGEPSMPRGMKKTLLGGLACYSKLLSLEVGTGLDSC